MWSLDIINFGDVFKRKQLQITNTIGFNLLLLKYLPYAIFTKSYDLVNTLLEHRKRSV